MYISHIKSKAAKYALISVLTLAVFLTPGPGRILALEEVTNENGAMVLVLEDCDSDNDLSTAPYGDTAFLLNSRCELIGKFHGLSIQNTFNGPRNISISEDGCFYVVCQSVPGKLTMYETAKRREIWTLWMDISSAVFANDMIYAVNAHNAFIIDKTGTIVKHARFGGLDIAVDTKHECLWIVGLDVKKCDLDLKIDTSVKLTLDIAHAGGFSIDINPDGSVWIAERDVSEKCGSQNRLVKISLDGSILKTIDLDFSPVRLRVDKSDGSIWTTGLRKDQDFSKIDDDWPETVDELDELVETKTETFTRKYHSKGDLIFETSEGGCSIELDPSDGSAWIAGEKEILHYSAGGRKLGSFAGSSDCRKSLAVIPGNNSK